MKTIYLIYTANNEFNPHFPESSLSLAGPLQQNGYDVKIIDLSFAKQSEWNFQDPLFFGITIFSGKSIDRAVELAQYVRQKYATVPIVWGGPHAQMVPEETAQHPLVTAVCYGEGEDTIVQIAKQLTDDIWNPALIQGLVYKDGDNNVIKTPMPPIVDYNTLPPHPYELLDSQKNLTTQDKIHYQSSRGCPFHCTFCATTTRGAWRPKTAETVLAQIDRIVQLFDPAELSFTDANFFVNERRARTICEKFIESNYRFQWGAFCRCDFILKMDDEFLDLLKKSRCSQLNIGGESGSDIVLAKYNKLITRREIVQTVDKLEKAGIRAELSFIAGSPVESEHDFKQTLSLIRTLRERKMASVNGLFPYEAQPNSPLGKETIEQWKVPVPTDLDGWAANPMSKIRKECYPWLNDQQYNKMLLYHLIVSYFFVYRRLLSMRPKSTGIRWAWPLVKPAFQIVHATVINPSIFLRWNLGFIFFPYEWKMFQFLRDKVLRIK
jgi:anaerobic magnesium-protoporphyrin IX monomethyl ester cyclase